MSIRLDKGRPGSSRCSTNLSRRALLVEGYSLPEKLVTCSQPFLHLKSLVTGGKSSLLSLSLPHEDFSSSFGSELCNFHQGHRKQSKARGLWINMSALIALQYETLPIVPEPPSAICRSQECPFLHPSYLHLKHTYRITPSFRYYLSSKIGYHRGTRKCSKQQNSHLLRVINW